MGVPLMEGASEDICFRCIKANKKENVLYERSLFCLSGYRDSNPGPPTPEAGALTGLRYTP